MAKIKQVESAVSALAQPVAQQLNVDLWDVRFVKEGSEYYLRITLDKEDGINITDCENFSRAIDPLLDQNDPIDVPYYLEVSSPGLGRPLTRDDHFKKMMGKEIKISLYQAVNGQKEFVGKLCHFDTSVTIETDGAQLKFEKQQISSVKLNDDADLF